MINFRATNDNDEVFDDEDWENQQQPTTSRRIHFPPFKPSVNRRLDYHFSSDPDFQKKLYNPVERYGICTTQKIESDDNFMLKNRFGGSFLAQKSIFCVIVLHV